MSPLRVVLAPPERWSEERLLDAARGLPLALPGVEVGDAVGELVVVGVETSAAPAVEIVPHAVPRATRTVDVWVLVDCGASMGERWSAEHSRAQAAWAALAAFRQTLPRRVVGLDVFPFAATLHEPLALMAEGATLPAPRGKAKAGTALQSALAKIAAKRHGPAREIILLTDAPSESALLLETASRAGRLGIPIHVVVFAPAEDATLREVARRSGGTIQRAQPPLMIHMPEESA